MATLSPVSSSSATTTSSVLGTSPSAPVSALVATTITPVINTDKPKTSKPRKRVNTAEKRSQHNAIERARRETLNSKFLDLARLLPSLASSRRPSKSAIVNGSISHLTYQRKQRLLASKLLKQVCVERDELLREVNEWRSVSGCALKECAVWTEEMDEVTAVEKEIFGNFAGVDGEEDGDGDMEDGQVLATPIEDNKFLPLNNGMWTEFGYGMNPANGFVSSASDTLSQTSPVGSQAHTTVLTPPMSATEPQTVYNHTPSPSSSQSAASVVEAPKDGMPAVPSQTNNFNQQLLNWSQFFQHPMQQPETATALPRPPQQVPPQSHNQRFNPMLPETFNGMFNPLQMGHGVVPGQAQDVSADAFTQQLMASMFPGKYAAQPSISDLQKAVRAGMGLGLGMMGNQWPQENAVEGF
ncbi:hypothetical protein C366_06711 [Cryptococcus neoformans Tu401-1]|nr:hypothetical protein C365_06763 [Cryptococcus neoformans var. grubii Bt85]OXG10469.1 hypothetical protein C366_06711 [Cryptococcus neoformans var. grubii Tu401-1]OXM75662.1 hypothetical protein C364_06687 [Cryptococcus neoformans var. grubii Bt63]